MGAETTDCGGLTLEPVGPAQIGPITVGPNRSLMMGRDGQCDVLLDGKNVSATASFVDSTSDSFDGVEGTLEATCP